MIFSKGKRKINKLTTSVQCGKLTFILKKILILTLVGVIEPIEWPTRATDLSPSSLYFGIVRKIK